MPMAKLHHNNTNLHFTHAILIIPHHCLFGIYSKWIPLNPVWHLCNSNVLTNIHRPNVKT